MRKSTYIRMTNALRARPAAARAVVLANKAITNAVYVAYPCLLAWLAVRQIAFGWPAKPLLCALLVPGVSFVLVTALRKAINAPRPYEVFDAAPVIAKDTQGNSLPSRHTFSIFVIAMTFCVWCPLAWAGPAMLAAGVALAVIRVVSGVHFPRDVVAGAVLGIALGAVGFLL